MTRPLSKDMKPGMQLRFRDPPRPRYGGSSTMEVVTLKERKTAEDSLLSGWWLREGGGLCDEAIDSPTSRWEIWTAEPDMPNEDELGDALVAVAQEESVVPIPIGVVLENVSACFPFEGAEMPCALMLFFASGPPVRIEAREQTALWITREGAG